MVDERVPAASETGVRSVLRSLKVFEAIAGGAPARVGELATALELSKSTVQRALRTLAEAGWITSLEGDITRWAIAPRMRTMLGAPTVDRDLRDVAAPHVKTLRDRTHETVHFSIIDGDDIVIVDRAEGGQELTARAHVGSRYPAVATAAGWAIAAGTDSPGTAFAGPELERARARGYSVRASPSGEVMTLSAPVAPAGHPIAAVSVLVPMPRYSDTAEKRVSAMLTDTAKTIAAELHGTSGADPRSV
jgi:IclR family acetate operon transcriptional repressor